MLYTGRKGKNQSHDSNPSKTSIIQSMNIYVATLARKAAFFPRSKRRGEERKNNDEKQIIDNFICFFPFKDNNKFMSWRTLTEKFQIKTLIRTICAAVHL